jgi:hypothetical protein
MIEEKYKSLEHRVLGAYIDTLPPFVPDKSSEVTEEGQKGFYDFVKSIYHNIYDTPLLLYTKLNEDDFYTYRFNKTFDKKPKLYIQMQSDIKKLEDFLNVLFQIGIEGRIEEGKFVIENSKKINKKYLVILEQCGMSHFEESKKCTLLNNNAEIFHAWKWMASRHEATLLAFSRCLFNTEYSYAGDIYSHLLGSTEAFNELEKYLQDNGYTRIDNRDNQIALDYVRNYGKKDMPVKDSWAERTHGGISLKYYNYVAKPPCISLRVPGNKDILNNFELMDDELKAFVVRSNKKCDNCRYCVQTDKTGTRDLIYISVNFDREYKLCPLFPGFDYCWDYMDHELAENMIRHLSFINRILIC